MMPPVLILAGGFGTRLKSVVPDLPKPLADITGKPFLWWLLSQLDKQQVTDVYLSVGYLSEHIIQYFGPNFGNMNIHYIVETEPLGTGGAIKNACQQISHEQVLILNGDTLATIHLQALLDYASQHAATLTLSVAEVADAARYGRVITNPDNIITGFAEKGQAGRGLINAGVYLIRPAIFAQYDLAQKFSFEADFLMKYLHELQPLAYAGVTDFIDIGIPEDYALAQQKVPQMIEQN